jgi:squalene monooxygenase
MSLRAAAKRARGVQLIEATVCELLEKTGSKRVIGVKAKQGQSQELETFHAKLTIIADGCFSNFRTQVMGNSSLKPETKSYFVGAVIEDAKLPIPDHGNVVLTKELGPVLFYRIGTHETRMLVDVKHPLPSDLKSHILTKVLPQMPPLLRPAIAKALDKDRLRRMPNSFLPPVQQANKDSKEGVILVGDSWNMRHPLTGGGMSAALNDVVILRDLLSTVHDFDDWENVKGIIHTWHWTRKPLASTINILSVALYELFDAEGRFSPLLHIFMLT